MTTQHTPGPWQIRQHEKGFVVFYSDGGIRSNTAQCYSSNVCEEHGSAEANARLIASAPDLLAALQEILIANDHNEELDKPLAEARAAIAKATNS